MENPLKNEIAALAEKIREQARDLKVDTFLSFIYTSDLVEKYLEMVLSDKPVSRAGYIILHHLILNNGIMIATEISKKVWRSKYSVTKAIDTLEKEGFVKRMTDINGTDRRMKMICITRKGLNHVEKASISARAYDSQKLFRGLSESQLEDLSAMLRQIRRDTIELIRKDKTSQAQS